MAEHFWLGMLIVFGAGILNGSFTLPMKYTRSWTWENIWSVYSVAALLVMPWVIAMAFVPKLGQVYHGLNWHAIVYPALFGLLWGIAQTTLRPLHQCCWHCHTPAAQPALVPHSLQQFSFFS